MRAVITGADFTAPYGVIPIAQNEWPLARDRVRYRGEPVAAVAAVDDATAEAALAAIEIDIEPLPAHFAASDARAEGAALLHENKADNLEREVDQVFGDVDGGFASADLVLERHRRHRGGPRAIRPDRRPRAYHLDLDRAGRAATRALARATERGRGGHR